MGAFTQVYISLQSDSAYSYCPDLSMSQYQMLKDVFYFPANLDTELVSLNQVSTFGPTSWGQ